MLSVFACVPHALSPLCQAGAVSGKLEGADTGALAALVAKLRDDAAGAAPFVPPPASAAAPEGAGGASAGADPTARLQALIR